MTEHPAVRLEAPGRRPPAQKASPVRTRSQPQIHVPCPAGNGPNLTAVVDWKPSIMNEMPAATKTITR